MVTYNLILAGIDKALFPPEVTPVARDIVEQLCCAAAPDRLGMRHDGIGGIKAHQWFKGFNWAGLGKCLLEPPFVPKLAGATDTQYFDPPAAAEATAAPVASVKRSPHSTVTPGVEGWDDEF